MDSTIGNAYSNIDIQSQFSASLNNKLSADGSIPASNTLNMNSNQITNVSMINGASFNDYRNKIINGNFDIWQRGTVQTISGYNSDDRWFNLHNGSTKTHSQQLFTVGQTEVPGNPIYFSRTVVTSSASSANYVYKMQRIEDVRTFAGKTVTITFYAKADANKNIAVDTVQDFGTGGTPGTAVNVSTRLVALTSTWQKISFTISVPSVLGKTLGTNNDHFFGLRFWFDAGSNFSTFSSNLGQQSGTFDIARVSIVEGDATKESDPFSPRHISQEIQLCQRYYEKSYELETVPATATIVGMTQTMRFVSSASDNFFERFATVKRAAPNMVLYSPNTGINGYIRNQSAGSDIAATLYQTSKKGYIITFTAAAGAPYAYHWTADAEL